MIDGRVAHLVALTIAELPGPRLEGLEMTLIVLTVVVIALFIAVLAVFLFTVGALLNRTADNLDDCVQSIKTIAGQAEVIGPGVEHLNRTGKELVGALPLLYGAAESIGAEPATPVAPPPGLGYLDT